MVPVSITRVRICPSHSQIASLEETVNAFHLLLWQCGLHLSQELTLSIVAKRLSAYCLRQIYRSLPLLSPRVLVRSALELERHECAEQMDQAFLCCVAEQAR